MVKRCLYAFGSLFFCLAATGCWHSTHYSKNKSLDTSDPVRLNLTGNSSSFMAMENAISSFCALYPNVTIQYEYVQNYQKSLSIRLAANDDVDMFITNNIQAQSPLINYSLDLKDEVDLSCTYDGLIRNFTITKDKRNELYAIPLGGELRGMYVNTSLLASLGLTVPHTYTELVSCCKMIKDAGYIPLQGNPSYFGQTIIYPYICNTIANAHDYKSRYEAINACGPGISSFFTEPMKRLYDLVTAGFYDYKYVETNYKLYTDTSEDVTVRSFLDAMNDSNSSAKEEKLGKTAFLPSTMSLKPLLDKAKQDYHSTINYEFILTPISDDGGFIYLSPSQGIAINKNSAHKEWAIEFINYLFKADINKTFAQQQGIIPNTKDAMDYIAKSFKVSKDHTCQLGQVSFDYVFFSIINKTLIDISKCNNPKYESEDGKPYEFSHFMNELENNFSKQRMENKKQ